MHLYDLDAFNNLPDVSFIDGISIDELLEDAVADYEIEYSRLTGENKILYPADPMRVLINTFVLKLYQLYQYVDRTGKQDLLKYSDSGYLDHIAALRSVTRLPATFASTTLAFTLSTILPDVVIIPKGTLVTAGDNVFFATTEYCEIPAGNLRTEVCAECTTPGTAGNNYSAGRLNTIEQPFPYAAGVTNLYQTSGGAEAESDQSLAERTFLAPSHFSVAGPDDAYQYWVKSYNQSIGDVNVYSPEPGVVDVRILLNDGELPDESFVDGVKTFLKDKKVRPFTDYVLVSAPDIIEYDIDFVYYIRAADRNNAAGIQKRLNTALNNYILWQGNKIGRDINPSVLHRLLMETGAKRMVMNEPVFTRVPETGVARVRLVSAIYGGIEVD